MASSAGQGHAPRQLSPRLTKPRDEPTHRQAELNLVERPACKRGACAAWEDVDFVAVG